MYTLGMQASGPTLIRHINQVLTRVHHVGKRTARIRVDGKVYTVPLAPEIVDVARAAWEGGGEHFVSLDATYWREGRLLVFNARSSRITAIGPAVKPLSGARLLEVLAEKAPSLRNADLSEELSRARRVPRRAPAR